MIGRGVYEDDETVARNQLEALLASGTDRQIPAVTDLFSLRTAIRYADSHPHTRFVAVKGAPRASIEKGAQLCTDSCRIGVCDHGGLCE